MQHLPLDDNCIDTKTALHESIIQRIKKSTLCRMVNIAAYKCIFLYLITKTSYRHRDISSIVTIPYRSQKVIYVSITSSEQND